MSPALHITGDARADALLSEDPLALLLGMLLDQQITMETAFAGPLKLKERLGSLDAAAVADCPPDTFAEIMKATPAVHRFPGSMGVRLQALCTAVVSDWDGDASAIWTRGDPDGAEILRRLRALPGFGEQKAKIFLALLGKQCGLSAAGWRQACAPYGEPGTAMSVADIVDAASLARVRETKKAAKAGSKAASAGRGAGNSAETRDS